MSGESKKHTNFVSHLEWGKEIQCHAKEYVKFTRITLTPTQHHKNQLLSEICTYLYTII